jgi:hypothetical protein
MDSRCKQYRWNVRHPIGGGGGGLGCRQHRYEAEIETLLCAAEGRQIICIRQKYVLYVQLWSSWDMLP